jgi:hypothetical protein
MSGKINLRELEFKAWRSFFDDGLWDIYLGLLLASMGASRLLDQMDLSEGGRMGIYIGLMVLAMLAFWSGKHFLTVPRLGRVKFGRKRKVRTLKTALVLFASVVIGLVVMLLTSASQRGAAPEVLWRLVVPAIWAINMLVVFGAMGYFLDFSRLYFIGLAYAIALPLDAILHARAGMDIGTLLFLGLGMVIIATGIVYLVRFLRNYPAVDLTGGSVQGSAQ